MKQLIFYVHEGCVVHTCCPCAKVVPGVDFCCIGDSIQCQSSSEEEVICRIDLSWCDVLHIGGRKVA